MYSLDTSVFMDWQARYYPVDVFQSLERKIEQLIASGECAAVQLVREEIDAVAPANVRTWATNHSGLFVPMTPDLQAAGASIEAGYPDLMDPRGLHESADAYVIGLARLRNGIVVSQETSAAEKRRAPKDHYIPDVCSRLGVPCINFLGLMRRERWVL
jgi:hypothetical protein